MHRHVMVDLENLTAAIGYLHSYLLDCTCMEFTFAYIPYNYVCDFCCFGLEQLLIYPKLGKID